MKEDFLHLLWQQQLFTCAPDFDFPAGPGLQVLRTGFRNRLAGPDFLQASLKIGGMEWAGAVEIHVRASEWTRHRHHLDPAYNSVILHVVWENDAPARRADGTEVPVLEVKDKVPLGVLLRYREIMETPPSGNLPCSAFLPGMEPVRMLAMLDQTLAQRLERKASAALHLLERVRGNPQEWVYIQLASCLGLKLNSEPMEQLACRLPFSRLGALAGNPVAAPALLLGTGGFLENPKGPAGQKLKDCFETEMHKIPADRTPLVWQRFRVRPAAFPLFRVCWLAAFVPVLPALVRMLYSGTGPRDFSALTGDVQMPDLLRAFQEEEGLTPAGKIPAGLRSLLLINGLVPMAAALGWRNGDKERPREALDWLHALPAEQNAVARLWEPAGLNIRTAGDSQALKELHDQWCRKKRCLECQIGAFALSGPDQGKIPSSI